MSARRATRLAALLVTALTVLTGSLVAGVAVAAPGPTAGGSIDHVEPDGRGVRLLLSLGDVPSKAVPDLDSVEVTFDGAPVDATAEPLAEAATTVRRTAVLAVDVSDSMSGAKFAAAKQAASAFLAEVPDDVRVGLVTYAGEVQVAQEPTTDLAEVASAVEGLRLSRGTRLYDGLQRALTVAGDQGARSVLVLSDGKDTSTTPLTRTVAAVREAGVKVDVVALAQTAADEALLGRLADAGNGSLLSADDADALTQVFTDEADVLARQLLVSVAPPDRLAGQEGTLSVTVQVDGEPVTDTAFVSLPQGSGPATDPEGTSTTDPVAEPLASEATTTPQVSERLMLAGLAAAAVAVAVMVVVAFGGNPGVRPDAIDRGIEAYTRAGAQRLAQAEREAETGAGQASFGRGAVAVAESVLEGRQGFEEGLGERLEAAGVALRPAEWLLAHGGVTVLAATLGLLLSSGNVLVAAAALLLGAGGPWVFLSVRRARRLRAFGAALADTLQLMAGSLSAGLSLAQAVDTVVREGNDPIAAEFRRALVEARLGVEIEESLAGIAERMESVDFEWVVMAIRIQREVGGNLSELLNKVADTIRERDYLVRQVKTLSAEGRMSVWILGGLPPAFIAYLVLTNPVYIAPLFSGPLGLGLVGLMCVLLLVGVLWMKRVVKVDV